MFRQLFTEEDSRWLPKRLNYCFSVLASATDQSIYIEELLLSSQTLHQIHLFVHTVEPVKMVTVYVWQPPLYINQPASLAPDI